MIKNLKELFERETHLKLRHTGESAESCYECSGASYKNIKNKVKSFNANHNCSVYAYNDYIKDVTVIVF